MRSVSNSTVYLKRQASYDRTATASPSAILASTRKVTTRKLINSVLRNIVPRNIFGLILILASPVKCESIAWSDKDDCDNRGLDTIASPIGEFDLETMPLPPPSGK